MLTWNLQTDVVTPEQWITGRVYTRRADLSPNGQFLIYAATNYATTKIRETQHPDQQGWTAISRPPYFTALALWFTGSAWNGGGIWKSDKHLIVNNSPTGWDFSGKLPEHLEVTSLNWGLCEDEPVFSERLLENGWSWLKERDPLKGQYPENWRNQQVAVMVKRFKKGSLRRESFHMRERWGVYDKSGKELRSWTNRWPQRDWVDVDHTGRVIFGEAGCLWAWSDLKEDPILIADLNPNKFEKVAAPDWAMQC